VTEPLIRTERRGRVAVVTLDDPERRNALSRQLCGELAATMDELEADDGVGAIVVTGAAPAFCAGADLTQLGESRREGLLAIYEGFLRVAGSPLPTIAAVNGAAVGAGMNLALAADVRLAGRAARFDTRFLDLGIHPGGGHTWMLRRIVGPQAAMSMVVFGQRLDGAEAERIGLVWRCVDDDELLDAAVAMAARAADGPPELTRRIKATVRDVADIEAHADAVERELGDQLWSMDQPAFAERLAQLQARISGSG
jgi:enoyl-CoA hydratase